tara:strand:+ start:120 stop:746 length:627 start_codon:yes stop_codon:yes gene_type:complete
MAHSIKWSQFFLPNTPLYDVKLPDSIVNRLWEYIGKAEIQCNNTLAGNIAESYQLIDEDDYFFDTILKPISLNYISENNIVRDFQSNHTESTELYLKKLWVNYQYKHEFNPMHTHGGVLSFVIWIKIPTECEEQHNLPIAKNSNTPSVSDFSFAYTDILGNIQSYKIQLSPKDNGLMMVFPSSLNHQVYPFYECDEKRVSISGNICWR